MEASSLLRVYRSDLLFIRGLVYTLSVFLIVISIWKYAIKTPEYFVLAMNVLSAIVFILLVELSKRDKFHSLRYGVILSCFIVILYIWTFGEEFNLFTWDTLVFVLIDIALKAGDKTSGKYRDLSESIARITAQDKSM